MNAKQPTLFLVLFFFIITSCTKKTPSPPVVEGMVHIPGGEFIMGTNESDNENKAEAFGIPNPWFENEQPQRKVYLKEFYIDRFEVTNEQYKKFIDNAFYTAPPNWRSGTYPEGTAHHPVTNVQYIDAVAYSFWQNKRIPSESEWEKVARGKNGKLYPWGNIFNSSMANLSQAMTKVSKILPVGSFKNDANLYGVQDMIGNVWEWTSSYYKAYEGNKKPREGYGEKFLVIKGLSYSYLGHFPDEIYSDALSHMARGSYRQETYPTTKSPDLGFRCIQYVQ